MEMNCNLKVEPTFSSCIVAPSEKLLKIELIMSYSPVENSLKIFSLMWLEHFVREKGQLIITLAQFWQKWAKSRGHSLFNFCKGETPERVQMEESI